MRTLLPSLWIAAVACGGELYRPKLVEIEDASSSPGSVAIERTEFTYDGDELKTIVRTQDTNSLGAYFFYYTDGWLDTVEVENAAGEFVTAHHFYYRDGRVSRLERRDAVFFADPTPPGERRRTAEITYGKNGVTSIDFAETSLQDPDTETVEVWQERYRYDEEGRIERITHERPGAVRIHELSYDEKTGLLAYYRTRAGGSLTIAEFDYEDVGRLQSVSLGTGSYVFNYDGDRVQDLVYTSGDLKVTTRYAYGDGSMRGITPIPGIPHGELFDLQGLPAEQLDFDTFGVLQ